MPVTRNNEAISASLSLSEQFSRPIIFPIEYTLFIVNTMNSLTPWLKVNGALTQHTKCHDEAWIARTARVQIANEANKYDIICTSDKKPSSFLNQKSIDQAVAKIIYSSDRYYAAVVGHTI